MIRMDKIYNKLVRDKIIDIINKDGKKAIYKTLNELEYKEELEFKLLEEYNELVLAKTKTEKLEELADLYELIKAMAELLNVNIKDVINIAEAKESVRGSFKKRIYLERVIDN